MTENRIQKRSYMPGLDGLRALAVFAVIGYHLGLPFLPGGFLGVTLFFVLSGYLITDILLSEWAQNAKISLKNFFIRRAKRLLPAVLFLLLCVSAFVTVFCPGLLSNLKSALLPAMFFFSNWWYVFTKTPYFASFATPSVLNHFWSLAVEAQFYLVWPFLLILGQRFIRQKWLKVALTVAGAILSAALMAALYQPGADPSRIYYGTDTRIFSLLLGACLAIARPSRILTKPIRNRSSRVVTDLFGFAALLGMAFSTIYLTQNDDFLYLGGMFLFSAASLLLIAAAANPSTIIGRFFSLKPLKFIGNISYGIYLWQFPVIVISNVMFESNSVNVLLNICQVAVTVLLATFSYYVVEKPIRKSKIIESLRNIRMKKRWKTAAALLVLVLLAIACIGLISAKPATDNTDAVLSALPSELHIESSEAPATASEAAAAVSEQPAASQSPSASSAPESGGGSVSVAQGLDPASEPTDVSSSSSSSGSSLGTTVQSSDTGDSKDSQGPADDGAPADVKASDQGVTLVGDSIGIDVAPYLKAYYPNLNAEAKVGRQFYEAKNVIKQLIQDKELAKTVVIVLGSNGTVKESSMRDLIDLIGSDRNIVFVNTQVPRSWCATVNSTLTKVSADYANTTVADWYSASLDKNDYFCKDEVHPNKSGALVMAKVISTAIEGMQKPADSSIA